MLLAWPHVARKKKLLLPPPLPLLLPPLSKSLLTPLQRPRPMQSPLTLLRLLLLPLPHLLLPQPSNSRCSTKKARVTLPFLLPNRVVNRSGQRHPIEPFVLRGAPEMCLLQVQPRHALEHQFRAVVLSTEVSRNDMLQAGRADR